MKKLVCLILLASIGLNAFSQVLPAPEPVKTDYLKKSKKKKKIGFILLSASAALFVTCFVLPEGEFERFGPYLIPEYSNDDTRAALFVAATATGLASIPFFISAGKNRRKALKSTVSLKMERTAGMQYNAFAGRSQPALSLKIAL